MDYSFFESLSREDAEGYLDGFKREGRARISDDWWSRLGRDGTSAILPFFVEVSKEVHVVQTLPPPDTPAFIRQAQERDHGGFRDFADDDSRAKILGAAFFLGQAFVQGFTTLDWSIGPEGTADSGQPVVSGFRTGSHLPALVVAENLLMRFDEERVTTAVGTWVAVV